MPVQKFPLRALGWAFLLLLLPAALPAQVTLTLEQFHQLRGRTLEPPPPLSPPPSPWALEAADFEVSVGKDSARLRTTLQLTLYSADWQKVPLGSLGSITDLDVPPGLEARVEAGGSFPQLLARGQGRHRIVIESVSPLQKDAAATRPTSYFTLSPPPAALLRGNLLVPAEIEEAQLGSTGGLLTPNGPQKWLFMTGFEPSSSLTFLLLGRRVLAERALLPLRFDSRIFTESTLSRTQLQVDSRIEVQVAQGRLEELFVDLPAELEVVGIEGGPIAGYKAENGRLRILPLEPVEDSLRLLVKLRGKSSPGLTAPLLVPQGSRRTLQLVAAKLRGDGLLDLVDPGSARAATEGELQGLNATASPVYMLGDFQKPPRFEAVWAEGTEVLAAQVDRLLVDVALGAGGRAAYQLWCEVRNRGTLSLELVLPPGFELISARRDGEPVIPGRSSRGTFEVPLFSGEEKQIVHVAGLLPLGLPAAKSGDLSLLMPALSAPAARIEVRLLLPPRLIGSLADPTRAGVAAPPPRPEQAGVRRAELLKSNTIAQQIWSGVAPQEMGAFFSKPSGFFELQAAWSALSSTPAPLLVHLGRTTETASWF